MIQSLHSHFIFKRRVAKLVECIAAELGSVPAAVDILDVGCGDGLIDKYLKEKLKKTNFTGIDILIRPETHIPVVQFDGKQIPYPDKSFDAVLFVDILHHTLQPTELLAEAKRVSKKYIVIKDHLKNNLLDHIILSAMDWVGNASHGVVLPYNYQTWQQWQDMFAALDIQTVHWQDHLNLYPFPLSAVFDRKLHFVALLEVR